MIIAYTLYDICLATGQNAVAPVIIGEASEPMADSRHIGRHLDNN